MATHPEDTRPPPAECGRVNTGSYAERIQMAPCAREAGHPGFCEFRSGTQADPESFGAVLADLRWPASQNWLARTAGLNQAMINRLERGTRQPSRRTVALLADALKLCAEERARLFRAARYVDQGVS